MDFKTISNAVLEPPFLNTRPGSVYLDRNRNYNMVIGADVTPGGRMWAAWVSGGDDPNAYFVLVSSDDRGETWSQPRLVIDPPDHPCGLRISVIVGNLWTDPEGRLFLFFDQGFEHFDGRAGTWFTRCDNPDADRPEWSAPKLITYGHLLNKPIVHSSGEWLMSISLLPRHLIRKAVLAFDRNPFPELDGERMANVFASTDKGETWVRRGGVVIPHTDGDEAMLVERANGDVWLTGRSITGIWEASSSDLGRTWTVPTPSAIGHINTRHSIRRLQSGNLLLVKHGAEVTRATDGRTHLTAFLSKDDGATWLGGLLLEPRTEKKSSYPDVCQFADGTIGVLYDYGRDDPSEILLGRFTEADVLAGSIVSPGSKLGLLVSRATGPR